MRTTRYYASLGLLPPPARRGRMAWYDDNHLARLEMIRALQGHGFTLQAIEKYLASLPADAGVEDLAVQRAMLTSWTVGEPLELTRRQARPARRSQADRRGGHPDRGVRPAAPGGRRARRSLGSARSTASTSPSSLLQVDIPFAGMRAAGEAIERHMSALAEEPDLRPAPRGRRALAPRAQPLLPLPRGRRAAWRTPSAPCAGSPWRRSCAASSARPTR
ncbi:helix-turn-helix domain-containing protein [Nocardioides convexus]|uniref:helix-turn-helix domain-containing protein n=1 Tax=Nocardioides convexus TaxID=2712224 RepID=UPI002418A2B6|nr:helix-turn-helix domain-containing protein [Nocardioides convexus]